jgi:biotin operon repressor
MMTTLCQLIMECRAIKGMDRLVLYGWAAQLEEGNDTLFCSKETVAETIGVSDDTVLRRTQALVKAGWLIETGEQKQWEFARTPVRIINVPVIMGLVEAQEKAPPHFAALPRAQPQIAPPQNAAQGSTGSLVLGVDLLCSTSVGSADATGVPPVVVKSAPPTEGLKPKTENLQTNTNPRLCPKRKEPWSRYKTHVCKANDPVVDVMDESPWDIDPRESIKSLTPFASLGGGQLALNEDGSIDMDKWHEDRSKTTEDTLRRKSMESVARDGKTKPVEPTPNAHSPVAPNSDRCACGAELENPDFEEFCYACAKKNLGDSWARHCRGY